MELMQVHVELDVNLLLIIFLVIIKLNFVYQLHNVQQELMAIIYQLIVKLNVLIQINMEIMLQENVKLHVQLDGLNKEILKFVLKHVLIRIQLINNNLVLIRQDFVNKIVQVVQETIMQIFNKIVNVKKDVQNHQCKHMD